ncbi:hypothetical protein HY604_03120 [Candidatus Peregrinibacteria bacterium]|nr:hypothetical protein [Candidatus Peregrinibacteria bacterium]
MSEGYQKPATPEIQEEYLEKARQILAEPESDKRRRLIAILDTPGTGTDADTPEPAVETDTTVARAVGQQTREDAQEAVKPRITILGRDFTDVKYTERNQKAPEPVTSYTPGKDVYVKDKPLHTAISNLAARLRQGEITFDDKIDNLKFHFRIYIYGDAIFVHARFVDPTDKKTYEATLSLQPLKKLSDFSIHLDPDIIKIHKEKSTTLVDMWKIRKINPNNPSEYAMDDEDNPFRLTTSNRLRLFQGFNLDKFLAKVEKKLQAKV